MLCYAFPDRLTKWVSSDAISCSGDTERAGRPFTIRTLLEFMAKSKMQYKFTSAISLCYKIHNYQYLTHRTCEA